MLCLVGKSTSPLTGTTVNLSVRFRQLVHCRQNKLRNSLILSSARTGTSVAQDLSAAATMGASHDYTERTARFRRIESHVTEKNRAREHMSIHVGANNVGGKSMRSQRFSVCGLLLMAALLGGCTTDASKLGTGKRVGGQSGVKEHLEKGSVVPNSPAERIGGQSGLEKPLEKGTATPSDAGERVGGQAGQEPTLEK